MDSGAPKISDLNLSRVGIGANTIPRISMSFYHLKKTLNLEKDTRPIPVYRKKVTSTLGVNTYI